MVSDLLIYGLADPRTGAIHYVGKSKTALRRPRRHGGELLRKDMTPKGHWVRELFADGVSYEIRVLEELDDVAELDAHERFWIAQGRGLGWPLTNVTKGGKGTEGMRHGRGSRVPTWPWRNTPAARRNGLTGSPAKGARPHRFPSKGTQAWRDHRNELQNARKARMRSS